MMVVSSVRAAEHVRRVVFVQSSTAPICYKAIDPWRSDSSPGGDHGESGCRVDLNGREIGGGWSVDDVSVERES